MPVGPCGQQVLPQWIQLISGMTFLAYLVGCWGIQLERMLSVLTGDSGHC